MKINVPEADLAQAKAELESVGGFRIVQLDCKALPHSVGAQIKDVELTMHARLFYQPVSRTVMMPYLPVMDWQDILLDCLVPRLHAHPIPNTIAGRRYLMEDEAVYRAIDLALIEARFPEGPEICAVGTLAFEYAVACIIGKKPIRRVEWFRIDKTDYIRDAEGTLAAFVAEVEQWLRIASLEITAEEARELIQKDKNQNG